MLDNSTESTDVIKAEYELKITKANAREVIRIIFPEQVVGVHRLPCIVKIPIHQIVASPSELSLGFFDLFVILFVTLFIIVIKKHKTSPVIITNKINLLPNGIKYISLNSLEA